MTTCSNKHSHESIYVETRNNKYCLIKNVHSKNMSQKTIMALTWNHIIEIMTGPAMMTLFWWMALRYHSGENHRVIFIMCMYDE